MKEYLVFIGCCAVVFCAIAVGAHFGYVDVSTLPAPDWVAWYVFWGLIILSCIFLFVRSVWKLAESLMFPEKPKHAHRTPIPATEVYPVFVVLRWDRPGLGNVLLDVKVVSDYSDARKYKESAPDNTVWIWSHDIVHFAASVKGVSIKLGLLWDFTEDDRKYLSDVEIFLSQDDADLYMLKNQKWRMTLRDVVVE